MRYVWIVFGGVFLAGAFMSLLVPLQNGHVPRWEIWLVIIGSIALVWASARWLTTP